MNHTFNIERSRALEPLFTSAPHPHPMKPYPFQQAGVEYVLARDHALIGDEPGLGKTCQGILISNAIEAKRTLVVCPASLRLNWWREIRAWSTAGRVSVYPVMKSKDGISTEADYVVISYALLQNKALLGAMMDTQWDHVILDEAHALKNPKGNTRTRPICAPNMLPSVTGRFTMLSGTILPNQPIECYNAMRLLNWDSIDRASLQDFRENYYGFGGGMVRGPVFNPVTKTWAHKLHWSNEVRNVPRRMDDLQHRLRSHLMVRRSKFDAMPQLPPKIWHPFPLESTSAIKTALKHEGWAKAERLYDLDPDHFHGNASIDGSITTARRLLGEAKAPQVAEYVRDMLESGVKKIIVSAYHIPVLHILRNTFMNWNIPLCYMDGSTSAGQRQEAVDIFQKKDDVQIILGQSNVIGLGWTLTEAQDVVMAEPDWVSGTMDQIIDRAHRIGQLGNVIGHIPVVSGTLDERVLGTAITKSRTIHAALDAR